MKVLWITNILFPEALQLLGQSNDFQSSGGWLLGMSDQLSNNYKIELTVAMVSNIVNDLAFLKGKRINYYILPLGKGNINYNKDYEGYWKEVNEKLNPDITHIHGTEFSHGLSYIRACGNNHVVVSIQGLSSQIEKYYYGGLSVPDILKNTSLLNLLKRNNIFFQKHQMKIRGVWEKETIKMVKSIIGRTDFDRSHINMLNPNANYYHCNETLRKEFYDGCWEKEKATTHSIFVSQSDSSIKGLHIVLQALVLVKDRFPDVKLRITGNDFTIGKNISNYGRIIRRFIRNNGLEPYLEFLGKLNAQQMKREYLNASVFVCASSIENSSNSISEGQILGVPCIASYVGGTPSLIPNNSCGVMYRFDDYEMLAYLIMKTFDSPFDNRIMREVAFKRHDSKTNAEALINIYKDIIN